MLEDKMAEIIKEEVSKAVCGVVTQEGIEAALSKVITAIFEPIARKQELATQMYIAEKDVGELFPISPATLKTWRSKKLHGLPYSKLGGRIVYKLSDLYDFIERHEIIN